MILILHILFAVGSVLSATWVYILPSNFRLRLSAVLIGLTLASGTYLVVSLHARLLQACITGLFYLSIVVGAVFLARRRLVKQEAIAREADRGFRA